MSLPMSIDKARYRWIATHVAMRQTIEGFHELPPEVKADRVTAAVLADLIREEGRADSRLAADGDRNEHQRALQEIAHIARQIDKRGPEIRADIEYLDNLSTYTSNTTNRFSNSTQSQ